MPTEFWARTDSNSANNPALNLTGDSAIQISFVPSGTNGDVLLEYDGGAVDPDTQVLIGGVAYDFTFDSSSTLPTANNQGAGRVPDQFEGEALFIVIIEDYPTAGDTARLAFLPEFEATQAEMDAFGNGAIRLQNIDTTTPGVICFAQGTLIKTPDGEKPVETLSTGDLVLTADGDALPIVWISSSAHRWPGSGDQTLPVLISAGALGEGRPRRDLVVSPLHKVLVRNLALNAPSDVLVPAKGLTSLRGIRVMKGKKNMTYYHVMLETHALLVSEQLPSESFYPGPEALKMLRPKQRSKVYELRPDLRDGKPFGPTARPCLTHSETLELAERMKSENLV